MLTTPEVNKLFDLLRELHGKDKPRDRVTTAIWAKTLEPWSYSQVRDAALRRARENRYYPDPAELAVLLPSTASSQGQGLSAEDRRKFQLRWMASLRSQGLPETLGQALQEGMAPSDWWRLWAREQQKDPQWTALLTQEQRQKLNQYVEE